MRYLVATQTASNFSTRWRGQVDLFVAGFQPSASQDQPNLGISSAEARAAGGVPPSELPGIPHGRGVFTLVQGRQIETVRLGYLDDAQRRHWLAQLPSAVSSVSPRNVRPAPTMAAVTGTAMHGPSAMMARHEAVTLLGDTAVSPRIDADNNVDQMDNGNADGREPDDADSTAGNATGLSDDEIKSLLLSKTPVRQIAMRLRGRMQKRLERIAGVRAGFSVRSR
jgi:hypothetical protein